MKRFFSLLAMVVVLTSSASFAGSGAIQITGSLKNSFEAKNYSNNSLILTGVGFFPSAQYQDPTPAGNDLQHTVEVNYRQVAPTLGEWRKAAYGRNGGTVWINAISPTEIDMSISAITQAAQANTAWSFMVCAKGVGCSDAKTIYVSGPGAPSIALSNGSNPVDFAASKAPQILSLGASGITTPNPQLKLGATTIWGDFQSGAVRFSIPASLTSTPGLMVATVSDPITNTDSTSFMIRVFGAPKVIAPAALTVTENLGLVDPIADATLGVQFAPVTFPTALFWRDGAAQTPLYAPLDLLTHRASIKVPARALRTGNYTATLVLSNVGGTTEVPVSVSISKPEYTPAPIPHPIPVPHPTVTAIPTFVPVPVPPFGR